MPADAAAAMMTDLRSLFRDSEARAARLKLLIEVSRDLAGADAETLHAAVSRAARRAALFAGYGRGTVRGPDDADAENAFEIPLDWLEERGRPGHRLVFEAPMNPGAISAEEDAEALRLLVELIEARLTVDLQSRREAELRGQLQRREKELEQVLSHVVMAQEGERAAISADLHDGVAQQVAALYRRLELLRLDMAEAAQPETVREVDDLVTVARQAVVDLRGLISGLRPTSLDDLGVVPALREEAVRLEKRGHVVTLSDRLPDRLPGWMETLLFRIGQEAFNNVAKHAPGAAVHLDLSIDPNPGAVILTVQDAGGRQDAGISHDAGPHFGLDIMRERLAAVAGQLEVEQTTQGFRIRAIVPLASA